MTQTLYEKYRPTTWNEVVGQDEALRKIETLRRRGLTGRAYWIQGASGTGKTTIARLMAAEIADEYAILEIDAADLALDNSKDTEKVSVRDIQRRAHTRPIGAKGQWCYIVNEAHRLRGPIVTRLLTALEDESVQRNTTWIFTTTFKGQLSLFDKSDDAHPLLSRCTCVTLRSTGLELAFALRAREAAHAENLDGQPLEAYIALAKATGCNLREMFNRIDAGEMMGGQT